MKVKIGIEFEIEVDKEDNIVALTECIADNIRYSHFGATPTGESRYVSEEDGRLIYDNGVFYEN